MAPQFVAATPAVAATQLDVDRIHVWRLRYASAQGRAPFARLLAAYAHLPVEAVSLRAGPRGKPEWAEPAALPRAAQDLQFNWTHSGDYALFAIARGIALGIDTERLGRRLRAIEVARRFFAAHEATVLAALDGAALDRAFIGLWCAKEAVLKSAGTGLSFGLDRVAFAHRGGADWVPAAIDPTLGALADWQLSGFEPAAGYRGALAWRGAGRRVVALIEDAPGGR